MITPAENYYINHYVRQSPVVKQGNDVISATTKKPAFGGSKTIELKNLFYWALRKKHLTTKERRDFYARIWDSLPGLTKFKPQKILNVNTDLVFRGPVPKETRDFKELSRKNVKVIINFQILNKKKVKKLKKKAKENGMEFINIPTNSFEGVTSPKLNKFFREVEKAEQEGKVIYMCCKHGTDRTGRYAAEYKISRSLATRQEAYEEMVKLGYREELFPELSIGLK